VFSRVLPRLLGLTFAGCGFAFGHTGPDSLNLLRSLNRPGVSGWAFTDLDGDNRADLASAQSAGRNARGFQQELQITLSAAGQSSLSFSSRSSRVQVHARDIDGDHKRDLIIREALSLELVGVWLNDGFGNFSEGDASQFPATAETQRSMSVLPSTSLAQSDLAILEERVQAEITGILPLAPDRGVEEVCLNSEDVHTSSGPSDLRGRAPPFNS